MLSYQVNPVHPGRSLPSREELQVCNAHTLELLQAKRSEMTSSKTGSREYIRQKVVQLYSQILSTLTSSGNWSPCVPEREIFFDIGRFEYRPVDTRGTKDGTGNASCAFETGKPDFTPMSHKHQMHSLS